MKNIRVRKEMLTNGLNQIELAKVLGINNQEMSVMLKYELAKAEQDTIISKIREWASRA